MTDNNYTGVYTILASLLSGAGAALIINLLNKSKTNIEIKEIEASIKKQEAEALYLLHQIKETVNKKNKEIIYYDGKEILSSDFEVSPGRDWDNELRKHIGNPGGGNFTIKNGSRINIRRTDNYGSYDFALIKYTINDNQLDFIQKDPSLGKYRKITVYFDAKCLDESAHSISVSAKELATGKWLTGKTVRVAKKYWESFEMVFRVSPEENFRMKLYDHDVETPPSEISIRNLKVIETF